MTATTAEQPPEKTSRRQRAEATVDETAAPEPPRLRRRPMLIAVSVLLTALGALLGAWLLTGLSGTDSYIAVREDIERGQQITEKDIVRTELSADGAVSPVLWEEQQFLIGKYAKVDMAAGSLVTRESVMDELAPKAGTMSVGLALIPGQTVFAELKAGDPVNVVLVTASSVDTAEPTSIPGTVAGARMSDDGTTKLVDVYVNEGDAAAVTASAARQEVSLVLKSSESGDDGGEDGISGSGDDGASESPTDGASEGSN